MATVQIVKRARPNKNGLCALQLRVLHGISSIRLNTGKFILPEYWDSSRQCVRKSHPNHIGLNAELMNQLARANKELLILESTSPHFTIDMLKNRLLKKKRKETFFSRADQYFETLWKAGKVNRFQGERPAINHLRKFVSGRDLAFEDLTTSFLVKFKAHLSGQLGLTQVSVMNYLSTIRTIYNLGIEEGIVRMEFYPFGRGKGKIKITSPVSVRIGLEAEEVKRIEALVLNETSFIHHARNIWLFSFYLAGMRISDILLLRWRNIHSGRIHYAMGKNNKPGSLLITEKAQAILNYYEGIRCHESDLVFPDMRDVPSLSDRAIYKPRIKNRGKKINKYLKEIAKLAKIDKPLTMHIARHTFGNIAGGSIPLQQLQMLYRHSSITTTVRYQQTFINKGADEALKSITTFNEK